MKLKILKGREIDDKYEIKEGQIHEVQEIVEDTYRIHIPMKRKGMFVNALVEDKEAELLDD